MAANKTSALPFSSGAFLYFSNRLTAIDSRRTRAAGYSFSTSHMSFLLRTKRSLYPTERTLAVRRLPVFVSHRESWQSKCLPTQREKFNGLAKKHFPEMLCVCICVCSSHCVCRFFLLALAYNDIKIACHTIWMFEKNKKQEVNIE